MEENEDKDKSGKGEVIKMSELTPEQKAVAARQLEKLLLGVEPGDDEEVFYYLSPFTEDSESTDESVPSGSTAVNRHQVTPHYGCIFSRIRSGYPGDCWQ